MTTFERVSVRPLVNRRIALLILALFGTTFDPSIAEGQSSAIRLASASGTLQGVVRFTGSDPLPRPTVVRNTTDPAICGRTHTLEDWVFSARDRGVQNVIVTVENVPADKVPAGEPRRLVLDNRRCNFLPHASVLTAGSTIEIINSDPILHTVHFYGPVDVNIALPLKGMRSSRRLDTPGIAVVKCDVHGWMQAFVKVDPHPFHDVSNTSGSFRISGIPPGNYVLHAWHEKLGDRRDAVTIRAGAITSVTVEYSADTK